MASVVQRIATKNLAHPPSWLPPNVQWEVLMGSVAYGCSSDISDCDIYGWTIPRKEDVFRMGEIPGFGRQHQRFEQWQHHHIEDPEARKSYDCSIYSIVKFFQLVMENNPNMVDSLFVPRRCVLYSTPIGEMVREKRKMFLHKGGFHKFKGYAYSALHGINKRNKSSPKRQELIQRFGYDTKWAYHVVRLTDECEQILVEHDLDLERNREQLKAIRRGQWTLEYLHEWFGQKESHLEETYTRSTLRHDPDEPAIRQLLLDCLEHHYGSLADAIQVDASVESILHDLRDIIRKYGSS